MRCRDASKTLAFLIGWSCASDGGITPVPPITIALGSEFVTMIPGRIGIGPGYLPESKLVPVTVHRNGYDGIVSLSLTTVHGIQASITPQLAYPESTATLSIVTPAGTPYGDHSLHVRAAAGALGSVTATMQVRVRPAEVALYLRRMVVSQGATNTFTVLANRSDLDIDIAIAGPAGLSTLVSPTGQGQYYVDVSAGDDAATGPRTLTVTGSVDGYDETVSLEVVVRPPAAKQPVAFRVCHVQFGLGQRPFSSLPAVYGYQNEGEAWTAVLPDADDVIRFDASERVTIAEQFMYPVGQYAPGTLIRVMHLTATELTQMQCPSARSQGNTFTVTASNATPWFLAIGALRAASPATVLGRTMPGPRDLIATGTRAVSTGTESRGILRRGVDLANGATIALDFASGEAFVLDSAAYSVEGGAGLTAMVHVHTPTTVGRLAGVTQGAGTFRALPEARLNPGELQSLMLSAPTRGVLQYFRAAAPLTLSLGPEIGTPRIDTAAGTITLPRQEEYPDIAGAGQLDVRDSRGVYNYTEIWQTKAWAGEQTAQWVFSFPDLGRFTRAFRASASGELSAFAGAGTASLFFGATATSDSQLRWARSNSGGFGLGLPFPTGH